MKRFKIYCLILASLILFLIATLILQCVNRAKNNLSSDTDELPVMNITLHDTTLEEIETHSKDIKYDGNDLKLTIGNSVEEFSDVQIKGRGNSTWLADKKPFQIKFDEKVDLLGLGSRKKYILLANAYDESEIRNAAMFELTDMLEQEYRCRGKFIELYIDDEYQGLYFLTTKVEVGKNSVDLKDSLGVLMEIDTLHQETEDCHFTGSKDCMTVKEAVFEDDEEILNLAVSKFMKDFNELEVAAKAGDFKKVSELIDVDSFAEYYLVSEFAVNPDAYFSSYYFYKNGPEDIIHAGPIWDYDYAFANRNWTWSNNENYYSPTEKMAQRSTVFREGRETETGRVMYHLMDMSEFRAVVDRIFQEKLSGRKEELLDRIANIIKRVKDAAMRDMEKWKEDGELFITETDYLMDWLEKRYDYFEEEYGKKEWIFQSGVI